MKQLICARTAYVVLSVCLAGSLSGCGEAKGPSGGVAVAEKPVAESPNAAKRSFKPISVGGSSADSEAARRPKLTGEARVEAVKTALQPLQVVLGTWNGLTRKANALDQPKWRWDWTEKEQPALFVESKDGLYLRTGRLTYLPEDDKFQLTLVDPESKTVKYQGTWLEPVRDDTGDDNKPQRTFKLELVEVEPAADGSKVVFNQQGNDRYLMEVYRKQGTSPPRLYDTAAAQRAGTSFALSDTDYGEQTCIVSEGLGTIQVNFGGKTYWVCCTGCQAAFNDEPERWLAMAAERAAEKMKKP